MIPESTDVGTTEAPAHPPPPSDAVEFPIGWLLKNAAAPIQYRAIKDVVALDDASDEFVSIALNFRQSLEIALAQRSDGTWGGKMLAVPSGARFQVGQLGTISAARRLLESGWGRETPPIHQARRILFRLLAEDDDQNFLFEFREAGRMDLDRVRRGRGILREAAAATLARAGFEQDPRVRGAASRALARIERFVSSPLAARPWIRVGNKQVLAPEAAPPSIYALEMLAFMPAFRLENSTRMDQLYAYVTQPLPRQESVQLVGDAVVEQPHLVLGDWLPHANAADADVPMALYWLELMARLQFLRRNEGWSRVFNRFLGHRDRDGVWHSHSGLAAPKSSNPLVWHAFPLEPTVEREGKWTDVTFRLGLIAKLSGRQIEAIQAARRT